MSKLVAVVGAVVILGGCGSSGKAAHVSYTRTTTTTARQLVVTKVVTSAVTARSSPPETANTTPVVQSAPLVQSTSAVSTRTTCVLNRYGPEESEVKEECGAESTAPPEPAHHIECYPAGNGGGPVCRNE